MTARVSRLCVGALSALLAVSSLWPAGAGATVGSALADGRIALRVADWPLSAPALAFLERVAQVSRPQASAAQVAAAAIEDHVLGRHAQATIGDEALFDNHFVALSPEAAAEASLYASLEAAWRAPLAEALGADGGLRPVVRRHPLTRERLRALLGAGPQVRLDDRLPAAREAALREIELLAWRIDEHDAGTVSLLDVWRGLTLQERQALYGGDAAYAMHRAEERVRRAVIRHWVLAHTGMDAADLERLQALMADHDRRLAFARWSGAIAEDHFHSAEIERLRSEVSADDIRRWYDAHPSQFTRTERVHARHVRCPDERCAQAASAALARGVAFEDVARRYSNAPDAAQGGDLGWIDVARARLDWLAQLAFAQPPGAPTGAVREPEAGGGWQIVQVLARTTGRHPVESETVRFAAGRAVAQERAVARWAELRERLIGASAIELNPALLGFGESALAAEGVR
jgi:hypothetical protein